MSDGSHEFSNSLIHHWTSVTEKSKADLCFYQSSDQNRFRRFGTAFADQQNAELIHAHLTENAIYGSFNGLLELFRRRISKLGLDKKTLVESISDYQPVRNLVSALLEDEPYERSEMLVVDDMHFEIAALTKAIVDLSCQLLKDPCVILITGWQNASRSAIKQTKRIAEAGISAPLLILVCFDPEDAVRIRQDDETWEGFLDWIDEYYMFNSLPNCDIETEASPDIILGEKPKRKVVNRNMALMAWPEALKTAQKLLSGSDLTEEQRTALQLDTGQAMLYLGHFDEALNELESIRETPAVLNSVGYHFRLLTLIALIQVERQRFDYAIDTAQLALKIAATAADEKLQAQARFIDFYVHDKAATPTTKESFQQLDKLLCKYEMNSSRIYCLRNFYTYLRFYNDLDTESVLRVTQQGINLAKSIGHRQAIAAGYHSKGIVYSYARKYSATLRCFGVSLRIRNELGEAMEIVRIHNGIGYLYSSLEHYPQALEHCTKAYEMARQDSEISRKKIQPNELIMTLYNFIWIYFCTQNYREATELLDRVVRICNICKLTHFPFRNLYDIYSVKGFCHVKLGEPAKAQQCLNKMTGLSFLPTQTGKFLRTLLQGALLATMNRFQDAVKLLEGASESLVKTIDMDSHLVPLCNLELLSIYSYQGNWAACERLLDDSLKLSESLSLDKINQRFRKIAQLIRCKHTVDSGILPRQPIKKANLQLDDLIRTIHLEYKLSLANHRLREVKLISSLQSLPERFDTPADLAAETLKLVYIHFTIHAGQVYRRRGKTWELIKKIGSVPAFIPVSDYLAEVLNKQQPVMDTKLHSGGEGGQRARFDSIICLPIPGEHGLHSAMLFCILDGNRYFDHQDKDTLKLLAIQLGTQLRQLEHREHLKLMSSTDALTGLLNRQALQFRIKQMFDSMNDKGEPDVCSLAFIDLDNFKAVNDTLGHSIGDRLLKAFSLLLQSSLRNGDIPARWGGDEFVVLLPNTDAEHAGLVARRILSNIAERQKFKPDLAEWANLDSVADVIDIGCSIGIAQCRSTDLGQINEERLVLLADAAMYRAKANGKGGISLSF